jgi:amino acid adenylation domain-containing protein
MSMTTPVAGDRIARASFAQERLFFLNELAPGNPGYVVALALRLRGELDLEELCRALRDLVRGHEALRTTYEVVDGNLWQRVREGSLAVEVVRASFEDSTVREIAAREAARPFSLSEGPLIRATVLSDGAGDHALVLLVHHIACDGWSVGILLSDLARLYNSRAGGFEPVPAAVESYVDYAVAERAAWEGAGPEALAHWRERLAGAPVLSLPADHVRPTVLSHRGGVLRRVVPAGLIDELTAWAQGEGASLFSVLLAAYATVITQYSRQDEVVVGSPVANRLDERAEALVGCLVNTLPLRVDVSGAPAFAELVRRVRDVTLTAFADQDVPFEKIVGAVAAQHDLSHTALFQTTCTLQNFPFALPGLTGLEVREIEVEINAAKFETGLTLDISAAEPFLRLEYSTDLFEAESMEGLLDHLVTFLLSVTGDEPSTLDEAESRLVTSGFNPGPGAPPGPGLLERFEEHVRRTPGAVAVRHRGRDITYRELDRWADELAGRLARSGVCPAEPVGVLLGRSPAVVAAILAAWKLGAAYVPLDPEYPRERLGLIVAGSGLSVLAVEASLVELAASIAPSARIVDVCEREGGIDSPPPASVPGETAYVIYTSGSTGGPKGVVVGHQGLTELFSATPGGLEIGRGDVWLCAHSFSFDFSVWEVWGALAYGAKVVVADTADVLDPLRLSALVRAEGITILSQTPGSLYRLLPHLPELSQGEDTPLRYVVSGGEALSWPRLAGLLDNTDRTRTRFVNMYGITEGTVHVTSVIVPADRIAHMRAGVVGSPLPSGRCYVLDGQRRPVGVGVPGELYIGGTLVARGYINDSERTAERFIPDPFADTGRPGLLYRTGDLAKWTSDGELVYLGREDGQVQIRGHRVECAEVEQAFAGLPGVRACAVTADGEDLVAFVCGGRERELRAQIRERLPAYLVPSRIVPVEAIPLTAHGKIDLGRLLAPRPGPVEPPPRGNGSTEDRICAIWAEVLDRRDVRPTDNFFELGGHSFALITLQQRMVVAGFEVSVTDLFGFGTVRACALHLDARPSAAGSARSAAEQRSDRRRQAMAQVAARTELAKEASHERA